MTNTTVIGAQWGDEGKGKIIDFLSQESDVVVRFQGGHNAGHTIVTDKDTYKLSLVPSGIICGKQCVIGNGVVVDPGALLAEIGRLRGQGLEITENNLMVSEGAVMILPFHAAMDKAREATKGDAKIGTTGRGIGPAYEDKAARRALHMSDLLDIDAAAEKLDEVLWHYNLVLGALGADTFEKGDIVALLRTYAKELSAYIKPTWRFLNDAYAQHKTILFEGAQAVMLDVDHGTYPYVTSSNTVAANAAIGSGVGVRVIGDVLGVVKAYCTRVGAGAFPTELHDEIGEEIGKRGFEFGTVTGRKRRCGWFDAAMVKQAVQVAGVDKLAVMKIDILDAFDEIKVCVGYMIDGVEYGYLPANPKQQAVAQPIYKTFEGWRSEGKTEGARCRDELPTKAVEYLEFLEAFVGVPITFVSTGANRLDTLRFSG